MQEIIKEYGPAIITVVAVVALVIVIRVVVVTDESSTVGRAFSQLISNFFTSVNSAAQGG